MLRSSDFPQKFLHCFWWGLRNLRYVIAYRRLNFLILHIELLGGGEQFHNQLRCCSIVHLFIHAKRIIYNCRSLDVGQNFISFILNPMYMEMGS